MEASIWKKRNFLGKKEKNGKNEKIQSNRRKNGKRQEKTMEKRRAEIDKRVAL